MPHQYWWFSCCSQFRAGRPFCNNCGGKGKYLGWRRTPWEEMCAFSRLTGLFPYGKKRMSPEGQAIAARLIKCSMCDGIGVLDHPYDSDSWAYCPHCQGNGAALDGEFFPETVQAPRKDRLPENSPGD
jgi:hypothetical protein